MIVTNGISYRLYATFLFIIFYSSAASAQTLNLYDAVNKTLANYPLLQQRTAEVNAGKANVKTVNDYRIPSLMLHDQVTMGTDNSLPGSYFPLGIVPSTSGGTGPVNNGSANTGNIAISYLQWEFYNFGYYNAQQREAIARVNVSKANLNSDTYSITENMISLYLDWIKKYRLLQIENENVLRAQTILTAIRATVLSGLKPGVDSSTAGAAYADARIRYLQAMNDYESDRIAITTYTGLSNADVAPDTGSVMRAMQHLELSLQPGDSVAPNHPLLDVYEKQYEQQLAGNKAISKKYLPKLNIEGAAWMRGSSIDPNGTYTDLGNGLGYSRYNYLLGLSLSYNITDLKHRHDQLTEGRYLANARQNTLQTEQLNLNKVLQQANTAYGIAVEKLNTLPYQLQSATQAYGQQLALYRAGLNTLIDVTNAQYVLKQAETNYVVAQDDLLQLLQLRAGLSNQSAIFLQNFKP